jgi:hypothetical protein
MNNKLKFGFVLLLLIVGINVQAAQIMSNGSGGGAWGDPATWSPAGVPGCGDTITINAGDIVSIEVQQDYSEPGCMSPMFITIDGTLDFPLNGPKLRLPCGSGVMINAGGSLTASAAGGSGSANFLEICGVIEWRKADGDQFGPLVFGTPLPIELLSFEANVNGDQVDLKWVTATELNNDFFTVERSSDGNNWEEVLVTSGAGNSSQIIEYFEIDYTPLRGLSYYRLKQTDFNGAFTYSNIVPVKFEQNTSGNGIINLFPSPASPGETVYIEFDVINGGEFLVVMRDIKGREFYSKVKVNVEDGKLVGVPIDMNVPAGVYLVTASSENQMYSQKLIIK